MGELIFETQCIWILQHGIYCWMIRIILSSRGYDKGCLFLMSFFSFYCHFKVIVVRSYLIFLYMLQHWIWIFTLFNGIHQVAAQKLHTNN